MTNQSISIFDAYEASGLDGELAFLNSVTLAVCFPDETSYMAPHGETNADVLDRIERSKKAGRNLFIEEWEQWEPEPDCVY